MIKLACEERWESKEKYRISIPYQPSYVLDATNPVRERLKTNACIVTLIVTQTIVGLHIFSQNLSWIIGILAVQLMWAISYVLLSISWDWGFYKFVGLNFGYLLAKGMICLYFPLLVYLLFDVNIMIPAMVVHYTVCMIIYIAMMRYMQLRIQWIKNTN